MNSEKFQPIETNPEKYCRTEDALVNLTPTEINERILQACDVIKSHHEILDCEIVQFFNRNYWNLVPESWCNYLMQLNANELALFMDVDNNVDVPQMPESLQKIREDIKTLSLSRKQGKYQRLTMIYPENNENSNLSKQMYMKETEKLPFYDNLLTFNKKKPPLSFLKYKCKDKKLAEIVVMGDLCFKASLKRKIDFVVDIGAGLGHLSRCLAYFYNINVVSIEREGKLTEEAKRLDLKFQKLLRHVSKKNIVDAELTATIQRITTEITPDLTVQQFLNLLLLTEEKADNFKFGLVGLHPCGNLAPTMLRLYNDCENCVFMNIASCCYNKMTILDDYKDNTGFIGFPMNTQLNDTIHLGKNQLGLALHALESHQDRFRSEVVSFKADFYRALVEKFIGDVAPEYADKRRKNVKTIGPGGVGNFKQYIQHSIEGIVIDARIDQALDDIDEGEEFHKILAFSALRHMFAPLIESVVLLDRLLYLKSDSTFCHVTQRFEPKVSPRVHVISAFK